MRPSGDQFSPTLPPAMLVNVTGQPPSAGISTICPALVIANVLPSGDSDVSPTGSTESRSSSVRRRVSGGGLAASRPQIAKIISGNRRDMVHNSSKPSAPNEGLYQHHAGQTQSDKGQTIGSEAKTKTGGQETSRRKNTPGEKSQEGHA